MTYKKRTDYSTLPIFIYALTDPNTCEIRYVGKAVRPKERLRGHINHVEPTHKSRWIQSLTREGKEPGLRILESLPAGSSWQERERFWIAEGKRLGWPLTNETSGGDGVQDLSPEAKAKMLKTWTGRKHKPESLEKIGKASKGRTHTPEYKEYMREKMRTRVFTEEHRKRLSNANRKLTDKQIQDVLFKISQGRSMASIAREYHVDPATIRNIRTGALKYCQAAEVEMMSPTLFDLISLETATAAD